MVPLGTSSVCRLGCGAAIGGFPEAALSMVVAVGIYFRVAPGVRVRLTSSGVRTSIGPREARVHIGGGYRPGVSTGAGPFTLYHSIGSTRRKPSARHVEVSSVAAAATSAGPTQRPAQRQTVSAKAAEAGQMAAAFEAIEGLHRHAVDPVTPPVAPPAPAVDEAAIRERHRAEALRGIGFWKHSERVTAEKQAAADADAEIAAEHAELERQHQATQAELDARWNELLANDSDVVLATLNEAFESGGMHAAAVSVEGAEASIAVILPREDVIPERLPSTTAAGNISLRKTTKIEAAGIYLAAICGHSLAAVREALAVAPGLAAVRVVAVRHGASDVYGHPRLECMLVATFSRDSLNGIDWAHAGSIDIMDQCATDVSKNLGSRTKSIEPIDLSEEPDLTNLVSSIDVEV